MAVEGGATAPQQKPTFTTVATTTLSDTSGNMSTPASASTLASEGDDPNANGNVRTRIERSFPSYMTTGSQMSMPPPGSVLTGKQEHCTCALVGDGDYELSPLCLLITIH